MLCLTMVYFTACQPVWSSSPAEYFCGGAIEYSAKAWHQRLPPAGSMTGVMRLPGAPKACPAFSADWSVAGGLGELRVMTLAVNAGGTIDGVAALYHSVTPEARFGLPGVLGQMLGRMFWGPPYAQAERNMAAALEAIRTGSAAMVHALDQDTLFVESHLPVFATQANAEAAEAAARKLSSGALTTRSAEDEDTLRLSLASRTTAPSVVSPSQLGAVLKRPDPRSLSGRPMAASRAFPPLLPLYPLAPYGAKPRHSTALVPRRLPGCFGRIVGDRYMGRTADGQGHRILRVARDSAGAAHIRKIAFEVPRWMLAGP